MPEKTGAYLRIAASAGSAGDLYRKDAQLMRDWWEPANMNLATIASTGVMVGQRSDILCVFVKQVWCSLFAKTPAIAFPGGQSVFIGISGVIWSNLWCSGTGFAPLNRAREVNSRLQLLQREHRR